MFLKLNSEHVADPVQDPGFEINADWGFLL